MTATEDSFKNASEHCDLHGCKHTEVWGHPCDRDENGCFECHELKFPGELEKEVMEDM